METPHLHSVLTGQLSFGELLRAAQVVQVRVQILVQQQPGLLLCGQRRIIKLADQKTTASTWQKRTSGWISLTNSSTIA